MLVGRREIVVIALLVGRRGDDRDSMRARVLDCDLRERSVVESAECLGNDGDAAIDGERDCRTEIVGIGDEAVAHLDRYEHGVRGDAPIATVVHLARHALRFAGSVAIAHVVEGIVVVLVHIPAADIVDVTVAVVVDAVAERLDDVSWIENAVAVQIADSGIGGVVLDVEHAIAVGVVRRAALR